jgi:BASS family bile acid:Na+ symporter
MVLRALAWIGRQGTRAIAAVVFVGVALPQLGAVLKPHVAEATVVLLTMSFLRLDPAALRRCLARPGPALAATAWTMLGVPLLVGGAGLLAGLDRQLPDLFAALMLQAIASPMMATPAFAALMGLDATLVLVTLVAGTALVPVTAFLFAAAFIGPALTLSPTLLGLKLAAILAGSAAAGLAIRRSVGPAAVVRWQDEIGGVTILGLFVFVAAVMEPVAARFAAEPLPTAGLAALALGMFAAIFGITLLLFRPAGRERALTLALMTTQRNTGLMLAAAGGALPELGWLYLALAQFPVYLSPQMMKPLVRRTRSDASCRAVRRQ